MDPEGVCYQRHLLLDVVEEGEEQDLLAGEDVEDLRTTIEAADTTVEIRACWNRLEREHALFDEL